MSTVVNCDLYADVFFGGSVDVTACQWEYDDVIALSDNDCGASAPDTNEPSESLSVAADEGFTSQEVELDEEAPQCPHHKLSTPQLLDELDGDASFQTASSLSGSMMVCDGSDVERDDREETCLAVAEKENTPPHGRSDKEGLYQTHQGRIAAPQPVDGHPDGEQSSTSSAIPSGSNSLTPSAQSMPLSELVALGLVPPHPRISAPAYPAHLPHVRCCYDSNKMKECTRFSNCYHLHRDGADRCRPAGLKPHEVYVPRPHFIAYNEVRSRSPDPVKSLPCNYGLQCKDRQHRDCAVKHKFDTAALAEYEAYLRAFRSYEFAVIQYYLSVNRARRELTDEVVRDAQRRRDLAAMKPW